MKATLMQQWAAAHQVRSAEMEAKARRKQAHLAKAEMKQAQELLRQVQGGTPASTQATAPRRKAITAADVILTIFTGGLWIIWVAVRESRR